MKKRNIILSLALAAILALAAVPAFAQEEPRASEQARLEPTWPPAWTGKTVAELKAQVADRVAHRIETIAAARWLSEEQKTDRIAAIDDLVVVVEAADTRAEIVGLTVSRIQLARRQLADNRTGTDLDYEVHLAEDLARAQTRLDRLSKVAGWAEAAGEDVSTVSGFLAEATTQLDDATGGGTVIARHDAVHIALATMTEAAVALDAM